MAFAVRKEGEPRLFDGATKADTGHHILKRFSLWGVVVAVVRGEERDVVLIGKVRDEGFSSVVVRAVGVGEGEREAVTEALFELRE